MNWRIIEVKLKVRGYRRAIISFDMHRPNYKSLVVLSQSKHSMECHFAWRMEAERQNVGVKSLDAAAIRMKERLSLHV